MSSHVKPDPAHRSPTKFTSDSPEDAATRPHVNFIIALLYFYYLDKQSCDMSWHSSLIKHDARCVPLFAVIQTHKQIDIDKN